MFFDQRNLCVMDIPQVNINMTIDCRLHILRCACGKDAFFGLQRYIYNLNFLCRKIHKRTNL